MQAEAAIRPKVHFFMNSKGGVGKSLTSCLVAQHLIAPEADVICFDDRQDPVLATVTLHELVIERMLVRINTAAEAARLDIGAGAHQHTEAAKTAVSDLITRAAEYADEQFRLAARAAADEIQSGFLKELSKNPLVIDAERVASAASIARWSMALAVLAASTTALIAIGFPLVFSSVPPLDECKLPARQAVAHDK